MTTAELVQTQTSKTTEALTILQRAVCLTLRFKQLGNDRKVDLTKLVESTGGDEQEASATVDESVFHVTKRLLDPKVLRPAMRVFDKAKNYLSSRSVSVHRIFGESTYLIPILAVEEVDAQLEQFAAELAAEVLLLSKVYEDAKAEQKVKLGPHFKESDYVSPQQVMAAFKMDWSYVSFASPDRLETVSMALAKKSNGRYEQQLSDAFAETVASLRGSALKVMRELRDRLSPTKVLRGSALNDLMAFCENLPILNSIAGDDDLAEAMKAVQAKVQGIDIQTLRDDKELRAELEKFAADATVQLESMVVETRGRAISFGGVE